MKIKNLILKQFHMSKDKLPRNKYGTSGSDKLFTSLGTVMKTSAISDYFGCIPRAIQSLASIWKSGVLNVWVTYYYYVICNCKCPSWRHWRCVQEALSVVHRFEITFWLNHVCIFYCSVYDVLSYILSYSEARPRSSWESERPGKLALREIFCSHDVI